MAPRKSPTAQDPGSQQDLVSQGSDPEGIGTSSASPDEAPDPGASQESATEEAAPLPASLVTLYHETGYPVYRRAGLELTPVPTLYRVDQDQLEILRNDPWVEFVEPAAKEVAEE